MLDLAARWNEERYAVFSGFGRQKHYFSYNPSHSSATAIFIYLLLIRVYRQTVSLIRDKDKHIFRIFFQLQKDIWNHISMIYETINCQVILSPIRKFLFINAIFSCIQYASE